MIWVNALRFEICGRNSCGGLRWGLAATPHSVNLGKGRAPPPHVFGPTWVHANHLPLAVGPRHPILTKSS